MQKHAKQPADDAHDSNPGDEANEQPAGDDDRAVEIGGRDGPDPVRFGDWEKNGRCIDF